MFTTLFYILKNIYIFLKIDTVMYSAEEISCNELQYAFQKCLSKKRELNHFFYHLEVS